MPWAVALIGVIGPGIVVMLADTDAGSLITAAQSGAKFGYQLVLPEILLIPVLYVVQEMAARLGIYTQQGHGLLIRENFGTFWAILSSLTLFISSVGALVSEFVGIVGVGELFGVSRWLVVPVVTLFLIAIGLTGSYRSLERIGILVGLAELVFIPAMFLSHPSVSAFSSGITNIPLSNSNYLYLLTANIGAVIMPWMIFYQQGAVIDKGIKEVSIRHMRIDTAIGAVVTQLIMIGVVVSLAATIGRTHQGANLASVGAISQALEPFLGRMWARVLLGCGVLGASLVAAIVASVAAAWGLGEVFNWRHSLNLKPKEAKKFYLSYSLIHVLGAIIVLASFDLVHLAVDVEVINALLLPIVLGFLILLEARVLPAKYRLRAPYRYFAWGMCLVVIGFALYLVPSMIGH
ncbi:MAG: divalent metal cation transporter [Acidimicrobiaceae bacterium]|nr:divalent metal cation transporter [Acidimicrobiaceae bacterium]